MGRIGVRPRLHDPLPQGRQDRMSSVDVGQTYDYIQGFSTRRKSKLINILSRRNTLTFQPSSRRRAALVLAAAAAATLALGACSDTTSPDTVASAATPNLSRVGAGRQTAPGQQTKAKELLPGQYIV